MPLTSIQIDNILRKEAALPDAHKRNPLTNYREGYFFVTLGTRGEAPILCTLAGNPHSPDNTPDAPR